MPPTPSQHVIAAPLGMSTAALSRTRPTDQAVGRDMLTLFGVITVYWIYVAFSNTLYAHSMEAAFQQGGLFAAWQSRLMQHSFLYPFLIAAVWASLRTGWQPAWRAVPIQVLLGLGFSILARPALNLGEHIHSPHAAAWGARPPPMHTFHNYFTGVDLAEWVASGVSFLLTYGFGIALITGLSVYQRYRDSQVRYAALERSLAATRLSALRMQLSPHTLFNLLHTIRGQIGWDPVSAQTMVVQLSDVLRRLLAAGERDFSRLADEFQFVRLYLELQRSRFSDRLSIEMMEPGELSKLWIPSLILQPLVENAVAHGLAGHAGPVNIRVEASVADLRLRLRVINSVAAGAAAGAHGIGLRNVRERLSLHFGEGATLRASTTDARTWVAEIDMPRVDDAVGGRRNTN